MQFRDNKRRASFLKTEHRFASVHSGWFCVAVPGPGSAAQTFKDVVKLNTSEH